MGLGRRLLHSSAIEVAVSRSAAWYIRLVWITGRWTIENREIADRLVAERRPFIACFWHGRMLMIPNAWRYDARMSILISRHRDGRLISRALRHLGIGTIEGSTSRGAGSALMGMVRALRRGEYVGVTPDGPRGPRMRAAPGAVAAARLTGVPLLPVSYGARWRRVMGSWDRFVLPWPFTRGILRIGSPIEIARDADDGEVERVRRRLEAELIALTHAIDSDLGVEPVAPAPEPELSELHAAGSAK